MKIITYDHQTMWKHFVFKKNYVSFFSSDSFMIFSLKSLAYDQDTLWIVGQGLYANVVGINSWSWGWVLW